MADTNDEIDDLVGKVVDEYFRRSRRGERPQLSEFIKRYPEISDLLKTVIPALQDAEQTSDVSATDKTPVSTAVNWGISASCAKAAKIVR